MAEVTPKIEEVPEDESPAVKIEDAEDDDAVPEADGEEEGEAAAAAGGAGEQRKKQSRGEKKARKAILRLGLKPVPDITRVTIKQVKGVMFVISRPDVFKSPSSDTYVVFGEAKIEDMNSKLAENAAEQFKASGMGQNDFGDDDLPELVDAGAEEGQAAGGAEASDAKGDDDEAVDETGVDPKDIELVIGQTNVSRATAVKALKKSNGDLLSAILEVTGTS
eukprot:CAMPEP_0119120882 /NCGR_PEP_ID=MMETSP1310-20130426/1742_1 /TAXON_ID=464262 /ORGANISM="Genus nov. species nov., Strain RCC2339" /LENGTH=220 /DNA_ID=CAMNT_0007110393 /DNA_START=119 /DNA_END=781 /DNA_ORIENTATION=+